MKIVLGPNSALPPAILEQRRNSTGEPLGHDIELIRASMLESLSLKADVRTNREQQYGTSARAEQALHGEFAPDTEVSARPTPSIFLRLGVRHGNRSRHESLHLEDVRDRLEQAD